jgi:dehydrogenase/reductase SDR family member 7B
METLNDKTVWITGASSGIGEALAYEIAKQGARLILSARNQDALERVRQHCISPEKHVIVPIDLEQYDALEEKANRVWGDHGPIDILINNGGLCQRYRSMDGSLALDKKIMDINYFGTIALSRPIVKKMVERKTGHIAVVSSMLGHYGIQTRTAYSASKHALKGYFESLRNELHKTNVYITMIYPGYINTHISENALMANGSSYGAMDKSHKTGVSATKCAQKITQAICARKAVVYISGFKERFGLFMARYFPTLFRAISPKFEV